MRIVAISDTHGMYDHLNIPDGDLLIHAGDILARGTLSELAEFNHWLAIQPHEHKIVIAGNHDWCFEKDEQASRKILTNAIYLQDEQVVIDDICLYGSPWQPAFYEWAFNLQRGKELKQKWDLIPNNVDVLITHGPPKYVLDLTHDKFHAGCEELKKAIERVQPKFNVFGHIHEGYGQVNLNGCTYINACINTVKYKPVNKPIVFEV